MNFFDALEKINKEKEKEKSTENHNVQKESESGDELFEMEKPELKEDDEKEKSFVSYSKEEIDAAFEEMTTRIAKAKPEAKIVGTYLERMCDGGKEVIIGMTRDPQFGPMIMFGLGGIFVEVMKDVVFRLAPLTKSDAEEMVQSIKSYPILKGVRGHAGYDTDKIVDALQRISQLVVDFPEIKEMDINPFFVGERGKEGATSLAADGRMTI